LRPVSVDALTGFLFFWLCFHFARFPRLVPPRHDSGAGLFASAGFGFARPGLTTETAKSLRSTI
jgi:hypothetical protein